MIILFEVESLDGNNVSESVNVLVEIVLLIIESKEDLE